jgi:hypothetical protein
LTYHYMAWWSSCFCVFFLFQLFANSSTLKTSS